MSAEQLAAIAGVVLSLVFSYVPGLSDWYGALEATQKRLVMAGLLLAVAGGAFGLSCGNVIVSVTCDKAGVIGLISALIAALVANQATYQLSPRKLVVAP
jgi:hypothetical protein